MAQADEFKTQRYTRFSPGSIVDDGFRNFEAAFAKVFGLTQDSDYNAAMSIGVGPAVTLLGTLTLADHPEAALEVATKAYVDANVNTTAAVRAQLTLTSNKSIPGGTPTALTFDAAPVEVGGNIWDVANPTRIVIPNTGDYLLTGCIVGVGDVVDTNFTVALRKNGTTYSYTNLAWGTAGVDIETGVSFAVLDRRASDDYYEVMITATGNHEIDDDTIVSLMRVGGSTG